MRPKRKREEFLDDEIFQICRVEYCDGCKGSFYACETGCYEDCEGFQDDYDSVVKDALEEARLMTEDEE
jgi:hypothetical protein